MGGFHQVVKSDFFKGAFASVIRDGARRICHRLVGSATVQKRFTSEQVSVTTTSSSSEATVTLEGTVTRSSETL